MWEQIRANRRRSMLLIIAMALVLMATGWAFGELLLGQGHGVLGIPVGLIILGVQLLIYRFAAESVLLQGSNARQLVKEDSPRLFNIVEEMMLASGLQQQPKIYLIDDAAPNAFAMGRNPENSVVAVTSGLLHRLNRDELQGVVAHEIAHINNRDIQFMTLAGVMLGSIAIMSDWVWHSMRYGGRSRSRSSSRGSGGGGAEAALLVVAMVVAILGPILAQLLYYASSRRREFLADACGAQYTRYPDGLASALEKIATSGISLAGANRVTEAMCIINPKYAALGAEPTSVFATHPPAAVRIAVLREMSGAGLNSYEAAYAAVAGKSVIGRESLAEAESLPAREASGEGPIESRHDARGMALRRSGYLGVVCAGCSAEMSVAPTFTESEIRCIRCGARNPIPAAQPDRPGNAGPPGLPGGASSSPLGGVPIPPAAAEMLPLHYVRSSRGWESFRCECGRTVQLSPNFSAPQTQCPSCRRKILIEPAA